MKKVFFIGFNRCATKSFHYLFQNSGYKSFHYDVGAPSRANLAQQMKANMERYYPILNGIDQAQVYSDMVYHRDDDYIEGIDYYKQLFIEYPDAYFILQTRSLSSWINSRLSNKKGDYALRCKRALNMSQEQLTMKWTNDYIEHHKKAREFFTYPDKLLEYNIETDTIDKLISYVSPDFILDKKHWGHHGKSL